MVTGRLGGPRLPARPDQLAGRAQGGRQGRRSTCYFDSWYKELDTEARAATNELMFGRINADAFVERMQKRADAIKKDSSVTKFKR